MTRVASRSRSVFVVLMAAVLLLGMMFAQRAMAPGPVAASHFRSTQVTWVQTATPREARFTATLAARRSFYSGSGADGFPIVGDTLPAANSADFGDGSGASPTYTVTFSDPTNDFIIYTSTFTHQYATDGPWTAVISGCCRLSEPQHINNPDDNNRAETLIDFSKTTASPVSSISPIVDCALNAPCSFVVPAVDPDGQSTRFRFSTGPEAGSSGFTQPGPPKATNAATIDPTTGLFNWNTTGATLNDGSIPAEPDTFYSVQVMVENVVGQAVVSKTPVDFFIRLRAAANTNQPPAFIAPTPADGSVLDAQVGVAFTCGTAATDPNVADVVTLAMLGKPADATYATVNGNPGTGVFTWTPTTTGSVILTLIATDQAGAGATQRSVTINVAQPGAVANPVLCPVAAPAPTPTPLPTPTPVGATPAPTPVATPTPVRATPRLTLPPTNALESQGGSRVALWIVLVGLLAVSSIGFGATVLRPRGSRKRR